MRALASSSLFRTGLALAALLSLHACRKPKLLVLEKGGGVAAGMPEGRGRMVAAEPADGTIEHGEPGQWRTRLSWDPDPRAGAVRDEEALQAAGFANGKLVQSARAVGRPSEAAGDAAGDDAAKPLAVEGHPAALVHGDDADALVWRCEKSGRLFVYLREGKPDFSMRELANAVRCHDLRTRPENAQVPGASLIALGDGWNLSKRVPAATIYLRKDALLELFAGRKTEPTDDLVVAAHLAPGWVEAAGLKDARVETGEHTNGPQGHPAVSLRGEATLDGRPVRWSYLEWRCLERARTYGALVVSEETKAGGADGGASAPAAGGWTGHDAALLAVRCHG